MKLIVLYNFPNWLFGFFAFSDKLFDKGLVPESKFFNGYLKIFIEKFNINMGVTQKL